MTLTALIILFGIIHQVLAGDHAGMSTVAAFWGERYNRVEDHSPFSNSYAICVLEAGTLIPSCSGTFPVDNDMRPPTGTSFSALSAGAYFACGLIYGTKSAVCWGDPQVLLSNSSIAYKGKAYSSLSAGAFHVCALRDRDGGTDCWGLNNSGERNPPEGYRFKHISSGWDFTCGITDSGEARCWGWDGVTNNSVVPQPEKIFYTDISSGSWHVCALERKTRKPFCWGSNDYNQSVPPTDQVFSTIASGMFHSCGILNYTSKVVCWGDDTFKQVRETPKEDTFSSIVAGDYYTCGLSLKQLQTVKCWGNSIVYPSNVKVSQGLCTETQCSDSGRYELPDEAVSMKQCPRPGDKICLDTCTSFDQCPGSQAASPTSEAPMAIAPSSPSLVSSTSDHSKKTVVAVAIAITGGFLISAGLATFLYFWCRRRRSPDVRAWTSLANRLIPFTSSELVAATRNYSADMIIGKGGFGVVYKGVLANGRAIAIKKSQIAYDRTMVKELEMLSRLHHTNLVNLVGYCAEEKLLAFDYMENGSLYDCLFQKPDVTLDWFTRLKIGAQAARGLEYLHIYASPQILHRDVKAANILLDKDWNAHVADFGLSLNTSVSFATMAGTPGYIDPEYLQTMHFSTKGDVFSFGVVLLELLTGRRALESQKPLVSWVESQLGEMSGFSILDPKLVIDLSVDESVHHVLVLALKCTDSRADNRPSMTSIANTLKEVLKSVNSETNSSATGSTSGPYSSTGSNSLLSAR